MNFNFYNISPFSDEFDFHNKVNFDAKMALESNNPSLLKQYLEIENSLINFLKMFFNEFSKKSIDDLGFSCLAFNIVLEKNENVSEKYLYGLGDAKSKLEKLSRLNMNFLSEEDINFLFQAWIRGFCLLYLFDITTGSFLRKSDDMNFLLALHQNYEISEIFKSVQGVYITVEMDTISHDKVEIPLRYGEQVFLE
ncbi:hypothetical protein [Faucicola atlantae]|uniref:Uncharacterized protein n=1 Tax=Faucicola atlantae TaxID=34059 RepID=A0A1B8QJW0_9GAMM|nr:hypothetical protein [Moraxella atlantae]OBX83767.1 hypothetical protein A9306_04555 [Moraxella atlantae]